jgi:phosphate starvation-inducible membrane PsiE
MTVAELTIGILILTGVPITTFILNKHRQGVGWMFLAGVILIFIVGNLIEQSIK